VDRFSRDSRKIVLDNVHAGSVSKAIWPLKTRTNTPMPYYKSLQRKRQHIFPHAGFTIRLLPQKGMYKRISIQNNHQPKRLFRLSHRHLQRGQASALRMAFSLFIAGLVLALCILYSWTTLLILFLVCAIMTLLTIHLFFDEETQTRRGRLGISPRLEASPNPTERTLMPASTPVSLIASPLSEDTQPIQHYPDNIAAFPTTPMPATPIVRVLETIDLSSTNVEHFLNIHDEWHRIPESQSPKRETLTEQGKLLAKPQQEE
jgi:hypothetical protein